jgi:gas vesicle structural protein
MALEPTGGAGAGGGVVEHEGGSSDLADVVNTILDKGLVIDVFARVSLVGIELLRVDARIVVASVDTYLRFAESANRLGVGASEPAGLPDLMEDLQQSGSKSKAKGMLEAAEEKVEDIFGPDEEEAEDERPRRKRREREPARRKESS